MEKKTQMHCMADWFMLKSAVYLWTLGLQVRLDCVTFPLFQNILCRCDWTDMCKKDFFSDKSQADFSSCCLSWIKLIQAWEVTPALINCIKLGVLEQREKSSDEWFWPIFFNFLPLGMLSTLLKFVFCICSCTFLHRFWGLFMYIREINL